MMTGMSSPGRFRLPSDVRARLVLERHERPLAWANDRLGRWYVGTDRAMYLATQDPTGVPVHEPGGVEENAEGQRFRRLGWEQVERADWQRDTGRLAVVEVSGWGEPEPRTEIEIDDPGLLLELLRERVTKSVVATLHARIRGRSGLNVIGRRPPVGDGPIMWSVLFADGLDPDDPEVAEIAEQTLLEAEREFSGL